MAVSSVASNPAVEPTEVGGRAAEDGAAPASQGRRCVPTDNIIEFRVAECQPGGAADPGDDDAPPHSRAPTSSIGSQPSCSADSSPERSPWVSPPNHDLAAAVGVSLVNTTLLSIVGGSPQLEDGCCLRRADSLAGSAADLVSGQTDGGPEPAAGGPSAGPAGAVVSASSSRSASAADAIPAAAVGDAGPTALATAPPAAADPHRGAADATPVAASWFDPSEQGATVCSAVAVAAAGGPERSPSGREDGPAAGTLAATAAVAAGLAARQADRASSGGSAVADLARRTAVMAVRGSDSEGPGGAPAPVLARPHPATGASPDTGGAAAPTWSLESLRRMCPTRDPRLQRMQQQRQQQQQQQQPADVEAQSQGQTPHAAAMAPCVVAGVDPVPGASSGPRPVEPNAADRAAAAQPGTRRQQPSPAPALPLRRGPTTTTARLLMRLRPATAGTAAALVRQRQPTTAVAGGIAAGGVATAGGRKRKGGREGAVRRIGLSALFTAAHGSDGSDSGYTTDAELGRKRRPPAAVAEVHVRNAAAQPSPARPDWRLPPMRGRFDFLTKRRAARGPGVAVAAAAAAAAGQAVAGGRRGRSCRGPRQQRNGEGCRCVDDDEDEQSSFDDPSHSAASHSDASESDAPEGRKRRRRAAADAAEAAAASPPPPTLQQLLEAWRTDRSRSIRKTPEALLRLGLLMDVADRCPTSVLALEEVPGLPRPFVRRFGQEVLDVCRNHAHLEAARAAAARARREAAALRLGGGGAGGGSGGGGGERGPTAAAFSGGEDCSGRHRRVAEECGSPLAAAMNRSRLPSRTAAAAGGVMEEAGEAPRAAGEAEGGRLSDGRQMGRGSGSGEASCRVVGTAPDGPVGHAAGGMAAKQRMRQQLLGILGWQTKASPRDPTRPSAMGPSGSQPLVSSRDPDGDCGRADKNGSSSDGGDNALPTNSTTGHGAAASSPPAGAAEAWLGARETAAPAVTIAVLNCRNSRGRPTSQEAAGSEASAPAAFDGGEAEAAEVGTCVASTPTRKSNGAKRPMGHKAPPGAGRKATESGAPPQVRKLGRGDSPRVAAAAAAAATAAAAAAATAAAPAGWLPLPSGCRARAGRHLAYASTPSLHNARVISLLGILAEAGPAAAPFLDLMMPSHNGSQTAVAPPGDATDGTAAAEPLGSVSAADADVAALPAAVLAIATAAQSLGRTAALDQVRRLRAMAEAALPVWEVRRVLACLTLGPVAQPEAVLRLSPDASRDAVRLAFRRLSLLVHPDKNRSPGAAQAFALVSAAAAKLLGGGL